MASDSTTVDSLHTPEQVTARDQIAHLLEQVYKHHCLLAVNIQGVEDTFTSAILEVVADRGYLVLDELAPRSGNRPRSPHARLAVRARLNNVTLRFEGALTAMGEHSGFPHYQLAFPRVIDYVQRREYYRAGVPMEKHVPVQMATAKGSLFNAELRDISLGGFSARLRAAPLEELTPGTVLPRCVIALPDEARIRSSGQICYADVWQPTRVRCCGVRFIEIDRFDKRVLELFIAKLDSEMKRKRLNE
ncbi:MAG: flagellar brake protein [Chromatiales bacterium]